MSSSHAGPSACSPATPPGCNTTHDHQRQFVQRSWDPRQEKEERKQGRNCSGRRVPATHRLCLADDARQPGRAPHRGQPTDQGKRGPSHTLPHRTLLAAAPLRSSLDIHTAPSDCADSQLHNHNPAGFCGAYPVSVAVVAFYGHVVRIDRPWSAIAGHDEPRRGIPIPAVRFAGRSEGRFSQPILKTPG